MNALDEYVRCLIREAALLIEIPVDTNRLNERVGIVKDRLVVEADKIAVSIAIRRIDLDSLHFIRVLERRMNLESLDI